MLIPGKINILIGGQFGSEGKGLVASYLSYFHNIDISISNSGMNAGHTFYDTNENKYVTKLIPVSGILNKKSIIYLSSGSVIDPDYLLKEIDKFNINHNRIYINHRCSIIEDKDKNYENFSFCKTIASTLSGTGSALQRKIDRSAILAKDNNSISHMVQYIDIEDYLNKGYTALIELPQGFDLSINSGFEYPYCTSREITVNSALSDIQIHPSYLGNVISVIRTFPIRVGHIMENNKIIGNSGPFYPDSNEVSWGNLKLKPEYTTNTNRIRRIATFSMLQYKKMIKHIKPNYVFLNFANYMKQNNLQNLIKKLPEVTHICYGPKISDIIRR